MMISKFNRLIRNKFVWGAFAILVSVAMVGLFSPSMGSRDRQEDQTGKLFGTPVSPGELQRARLFTMGLHGRSGDTPEERKALEDEVWQRLAMLRKAKQLGITITDRELAEAIRRNPAFQVQGRFNTARYEQIVRSQRGFDLPIFEAYLREELIIQRLLSMISQTLWVPPEEVDRSVKHFTDEITVATVEIPYDRISGSIEISETDARAYYDAHPEWFMEPPARRVRTVSWHIQEYLDNVEINIQDIELYYDQNIDMFTIEETIITNDTETVETTIQPLVAVSNQIHTVLANQQALFAAERDAMDFHERLQPGRYGGGPPFDVTAAEAGRTIGTTGWFSVSEPVPSIDAGLTFNRAAFRLDPDNPAGYFSFPIRGEENIYIIAYESEREAYTLEWEYAAERAHEMALIDAEEKAFTRLLKDMREAIGKTLSSGKSAASAVAEHDLELVTLPPFAIYTAEVDEMPYFTQLVGAVMELQVGEVSEPIRIPNGALLAIVKIRQPGDQGIARMLQPDVADMLYHDRSNALIDTWAIDLLARARSLPDNNQDP